MGDSTMTGSLPVVKSTGAVPGYRGPRPPARYDATHRAPLPSAPAAGPAPAGPAPRQLSESVPTTLFDFIVRDADGGIRSLDEYAGQVTLVVNTANDPGLHRPLEALQELQDAYGDRGFSVLAFPCDQFEAQEAVATEPAEASCPEALGLTFPVFATVDVNGPRTHPVYRWLRAQRGGAIGGRIAWNFTKFLVGADGQVIRRYAPPIPPLRISRRIEKALDERDALGL